MDRLVVQQATAVKDGTPTALEAANLGLRGEDREEAELLDPRAMEGATQEKVARGRIRSPYADQDRQVRGIDGDYLRSTGTASKTGGRSPARSWPRAAGRVARCGGRAVFFPTGEVIGRPSASATSRW